MSRKVRREFDKLKSEIEKATVNVKKDLNEIIVSEAFNYKSLNFSGLYLTFVKLDNYNLDVIWTYKGIFKDNSSNYKKRDKEALKFYSHSIDGKHNYHGLLKVYFADYDKLADEIASKCEDYARTKLDDDSIKYFVEVNYL